MPSQNLHIFVEDHELCGSVIRGQDKSAFVPFLVTLIFVGQAGARPDQAHIPLEHVDELGQFVEAVFAQSPADQRHHALGHGFGKFPVGGFTSEKLIGAFAMLGFGVRSTHPHRTELVKAKVIASSIARAVAEKERKDPGYLI